MSHLRDLTGQRFGRLVVHARAGSNARGRVQWRCQCDCGVTKVVSGGALLRRGTTSCGCYRREAAKRFTTHGISHRTPEYRSWASAKNRCFNLKNDAYASYGGAGVTMCPEWARSFPAFLADMGPRPSLTHSLDRWPDNNGNYAPGNCRWATPTEQSRNRRRTRGWRKAKDAGVRAVLEQEEA